jgi:chromosome segregation ATPase
MTNDLQKASDDLIKTKTELAQLRLKTATEREQAYAEMHQLANTLVENKKQMKNAKESELELRLRLQSYDEKFTALQSSLVTTNSGYSAFTGEMEQVFYS